MLSTSELAELSRLTGRTHATTQRLDRRLRQQAKLAKLLGAANDLARRIESDEAREAGRAAIRYPAAIG